jgi:hypothetical protein
MNEQDLRDCFAMFKIITGASPEECYKFADEMLEARKKDEEVIGLPAIKRKARAK